MENNKKEHNGFVKAMLLLGTYISNIWFDFIQSFKYNNMKLPGWLIAMPGIFIGFFLKFHAPVVKGLSYVQTDIVDGSIVEINYLGFDFTGIVLFVLMLFGILNIFTAAGVMGKKNLGSVVTATITTAIICVCGALYIYAIFFYKALIDARIIVADFVWNTDYILSLSSIIFSMVTSVAGCVLGYIFYDRNYEKDERK